MAENKKYDTGRIYILASFNNTLATLTDHEGNTILWSSAGKMGFKGTRKATPYAATTMVDEMVRKGKDEYGIKELAVFINGPGPGRDASLRAIRGAGVKIGMIADVTPMPHDGPRAKKRRRA